MTPTAATIFRTDVPLQPFRVKSSRTAERSPLYVAASAGSAFEMLLHLFSFPSQWEHFDVTRICWTASNDLTWVRRSGRIWAVIKRVRLLPHLEHAGYDHKEQRDVKEVDERGREHPSGNRGADSLHGAGARACCNGQRQDTEEKGH